MIAIIYRSKITQNFPVQSIELMLLKARIFNKRNTISGCIFYANNCFLQMIEGKDVIVKKLYEKIKADDRHSDIETLLIEKTDKRMMEDWSMVYYNMNDTAENVLLKKKFFNSELLNSKNVDFEKKQNILTEHLNDILYFQKV